MKHLKKRLLLVVPLVALLALVFATPAFAQDGGPTPDQVAAASADATLSINIMWMLIGGFLVFFMQAGFALVETGFTRNKNVTHTMMMNIMVFCIGAVGYWLTGFAFQFGGVNAAYPEVARAGVIAGEWAHSPVTLGDWSGLLATPLLRFGQFGILGGSGFMLAGIPAAASGVLAFFLFQMVFMDTAATIPTGSMAERLKFVGFVVMSLWVSMFIYPLVAGWIWGGAEGIGTIAAAFWPKPVVVRMSDFKTNEYASLVGGGAFEPDESNPMIGFRGASRYAHPAYAEGFALECQAMKRVREQMGLTNVVLMIPFVRRVAEADLVLEEMAKYGLRRGENGLKVYAMCEIPNNVLLIDEFAKRFDGFSIGSNDLTQLTLGVDRDSEIVAFDYDERDEGVKEMIRLAVEGCRRNGIHSGLCGQAPSDYPDMAEFLVRVGIDSMSLNPDTVVKTTRQILQVEQQLAPVQ